MSSKRKRRRKECEGKVRHDTAEAAYKAMRRTDVGGVRRMGYYVCQFCGGYHVGHNRGRQAVRNRSTYKWA